MNEMDRNLVLEIAVSVSHPVESLDEFFNAWIFDAGHDGTATSVDELKRAWNGEEYGIDWHSIGFVAGEQLAGYATPPRCREDIPRWVFAALLIRDAIGNGYSDWELQEGLIAQLLDKSGHLTRQQKQQIEQCLGHSFEGIAKIHEIGGVEIWGRPEDKTLFTKNVL